VAIARSLIKNPAIILADEPTGNLDSRSGKDVLGVLRQINREGHTIVVVSHDPNVIAETGRSIRLHDGRVLEEGISP
jgi:putative ABC transport system ATP-binding protein